MIQKYRIKYRIQQTLVVEESDTLQSKEAFIVFHTIMFVCIIFNSFLNTLNLILLICFFSSLCTLEVRTVYLFKKNQTKRLSSLMKINSNRTLGCMAETPLRKTMRSVWWHAQIRPALHLSWIGLRTI